MQDQDRGFYSTLLKKKKKKKTLSHVSAHVVNGLLRENQKTTPKLLSGKKTIKKFLNFKFYLSKLTDKIFPIWCNENVSLL